MKRRVRQPGHRRSVLKKLRRSKGAVGDQNHTSFCWSFLGQGPIQGAKTLSQRASQKGQGPHYRAHIGPYVGPAEERQNNDGTSAASQEPADFKPASFKPAGPPAPMPTTNLDTGIPVGPPWHPLATLHWHPSHGPALATLRWHPPHGPALAHAPVTVTPPTKMPEAATPTAEHGLERMPEGNEVEMPIKDTQSPAGD
jgi:hypothetical protein